MNTAEKFTTGKSIVDNKKDRADSQGVECQDVAGNRADTTTRYMAYDRADPPARSKPLRFNETLPDGLLRMTTPMNVMKIDAQTCHVG